MGAEKGKEDGVGDAPTAKAQKAEVAACIEEMEARLKVVSLDAEAVLIAWIGTVKHGPCWPSFGRAPGAESIPEDVST